MNSHSLVLYILGEWKGFSYEICMVYVKCNCRNLFNMW